jgi:transposase
LTCLLLSRKKNKNKKRHLFTIKKIPDRLWNEIKAILPKEKPLKTVAVVGRPSVPYRTVLEGILQVLRTGCQWKSLPEVYGSGSTCRHRRFQQWVRMDGSISVRNYGSGY